MILTPEETRTLTMMLGMATSLALKGRDWHLAHAFIRLADRINEGNPNWTPYNLPPEEAQANAGKS